MLIRHWLLTSFEPFLGRPANHSQQVMEETLRRNASAALVLHPLVLPTEYARCAPVLLGEIARLRSQGVHLDGVLSLGEGREELKIETQANNLNHAPQSADNAGEVRVQRKIFEDREGPLPLQFPFEKFEIARSENPGFFVCNHLCAQMAGAREADPTLPLFGFIHVPRSDLAVPGATERCAQAILDGLLRTI